MKLKEILLLSLILLVCFVVRLYRFSNPIADWHSWRQSDTSAVSRNFIKYGFDILHPQYDDISNVQSGLDNPHGYRFVEFPIYNVAQAGLFKLFHHFTLEEWGRIVTIISSVFSVLFIYLLGKRHGNSLVGFSAAAFFALDPYSIYYGRTILPDPSMSMTALGAIYFFDLWVEKQKTKSSASQKIGFFILSVLFIAASLLLKPYAAFFLLPLAWIGYKAWGFKVFLKPFVYIMAIISIIPLVWWRIWMMRFPEGIPASSWLFNAGNIRFTGAYFYWIFAERISKLMLGYWGIALAFLGLFNTKKKDVGFFVSFAFATLMYVVVIARGNVQHDYYQILIIPTLALFFGLGVDMAISLATNLKTKIIFTGLVAVCSIFVFMFGWYQIRDYFNINNPSIVIAGDAVNKLTPPNAKIIAPYDGDTSFLYQTNRKGWPSFEHSLPDLIKLGADYLVLVNPKPADAGIGKTYKIVAQTPDYILFNLHQKP